MVSLKKKAKGCVQYFYIQNFNSLKYYLSFTMNTDIIKSTI